MKKITLYILSAAVLAALAAYSAFLFLLPKAVASPKSLARLEKFLYDRTGIDLTAESIEIATTPALTVNLNAKNLMLRDKNEEEISTVTELGGSIDLKNFSASKLYAGDITVKKPGPDSFGKKSAKGRSFDFSKLPEAEIKSITYISDNENVRISDFKLEQNVATMKACLTAPYLAHPVTLGEQSRIIIRGNSVLAEGVRVKAGSAEIDVDGKLYDNHSDFDFNVKGRNLHVDDIEQSLLYYQKSLDPAKKFIENFKDYAGHIDIDLNVSKRGFYGKAYARDLKASTVMFNIPVYFKQAVFELSGDKITSEAEGLMGGEKIFHTLEIKNLGKPDKEVTGILNANLNSNFRYVPDLTILNSAEAKIVYNIKNQKIDVEYFLNLPKSSDLLYQNAYLGLRGKERRFFVHTVKDGDSMMIKDYNYSLYEDGKTRNLIFGDGLLEKQNGKLVLIYITCKTNGYAPASVAGSFKKYIDGGSFRGNLRYNFSEKQLVGKFELINTNFKNFSVQSARISADKTAMDIKAEGTYAGEKFNCDIKADNHFENEIAVRDMNLFLDKFTVKRGSNKQNTGNIGDLTSRVSEITIDNWNIRLNQIVKDRIVLENIELNGSLKNDIFKFTMKEAGFADGTLIAKGECDFANETADIDFAAKNIDSDKVADIIFNLPGQVEGTADAKLKVYLNPDEVKAIAEFAVAQGFLPKIGSTEFMLKNRHKITPADLVNVDLTRKDAFESDLKGNFNLVNSKIDDVRLTSQQKYLSMFIEGDYDLDEHYANLNLFGKYNKDAPKGVKILFIPLNWILKAAFRPEKSKDLYKSQIDQIPPIEGADEKFFRVKMQGDIDKVKVELKAVE